MNHYERLGLEPRATTLQIRASFRALAKAAHPDVGGDPEAFRLLREAHDCLVDPLARKDYDTRQGLRTAPAPVGSAQRGWAGPEGDFTGNVEWPAYLRDVADAPWRARDPDAVPDPDEPAGRGAFVGPARVAWSWPGPADRDPVPAGALVVLTAGREVAACEVVGGHELWRADLGRRAVVPPVVVDETVVALSAGPDIQAFELGRGVQRWHLRTAEPAVDLAADDDVVVVGLGSRVVGFDAATGAQRWATRVSGPVAQVGVAAGIALVHTARGTLDGVDMRKGRHRFALKGVPSLEAGPVAASGLLWVVSRGSRIVGLDPLDGRSPIALTPGLTVCGIAAADDGLLIATIAGPEEVVAFDRRGGVRWRSALPSAALGPAVDERFAYVLTGEQRFLVFDRRDGSLVGDAATECRPVADPVAVPGRVVARDAEGVVWALAPPDAGPH